MNPAIRVESLSKCYRVNLSAKNPGRGELRGALTEIIRSPLHRLRRGAAYSRRNEEFWALRDVNFEVEPAEVVGIIGKNGSGKSTLLKILSRITCPTQGRAEIRGRVGSLLEVGTGFHQELSGRENIYLNGALLGMRRREIDRKFDAIVAFSGVDRFLDTPVKRYSSGMRVRLAFAVAAHLEPEILIIDEVLAVGDAAFQKKCLGQMNEAAGRGCTVLFVSHNMAAVQAFCKRCFLLSEGRITHEGEAADTVQAYLADCEGQLTTSDAVEFGAETIHLGTGQLRYTSLRLLNQRGESSSIIPAGEGLTLELSFELNGPQVHFPNFIVILSTAAGLPIARLTSDITHGCLPSVTQRGRIRLLVEQLNLLPGVYSVSIAVRQGTEVLDRVTDAASFEISPAPVYPTGKLPPSEYLAFYSCKWEVEYGMQD